MGRREVFTTKKMKDHRFRKTEEKILTVFFDESKNGITMVKMAKKAGVGRSTIYVHHHAIREIMSDWERYILAEYRLILRKRIKKDRAALKKMYFDMLIFILRNQKAFGMFLRLNNREVMKKMLDALEPKIRILMRLPKNSRKIFRLYESEVIEIIVEWGEKGFSEERIEKVLSDIMFLTKTARDRLMPIRDD